MASDLSDIHDRVTWCGNESLVLAAQIDIFVTSGAYKISHDVDPLTGDGTLYVELSKPIPPAIRIKAGSIIHELRATLDSLACVLATRAGNDTKDVYFPISKSLAIFEDDGLKRKLKKLSEADRKVIAGLEPYDGGNPLLFALHAADLTRKHQRLMMTSGSLRQMGLGTGVIEEFVYLGGAPVTSQRRAFAKLSKNTRVDMTVGVDVSFSEPSPIEGRPVATALRDFTRLVHSIVELFD